MALQFVTSQIKDLAITNDKLAGSIANGKLVNSTISGIALGSNLASLAVDDSSIEYSAGSAYNGSAASTIRIKALGVTNAMLAGSIANSKLANSSVSFGGVSLALGASDATPAFDLADATNYPTSSLVGTITNAQLAGSIENSKLSNSSLTIAGNAVALGASLASATLAGSLVLSDIAVPTGSVSLNSQKITSLATPTADADAATKAYVDSVAQGLDVKDSVKVATTANITLSGTQTIDGVAVLADDRVLVKDQSTGSENGIYICAGGSWSRAADFAVGQDEAGAFTFVEQGTTHADNGFVCTNNKGEAVVGTDALVFSQFSGAGSIVAGDALSKTGNTLNVEVDGSSIEVSSDALRVKASGVTNAMLAGSIADSKLNQITTSDKVAGSAVQLKANGGLSDASGLQVDVDGVTIQRNAGGNLELSNDAVTLAKLGITPKFQSETISGSATTTIALTNRVVESEFRDGGFIRAFRNGQRMEFKSSGASDNSQYQITDNGSATSIVAGAAFEDGDVIFIDFMY